ncbi:hypothetical protein [Micromonospora polyrhachis]|uniref:Uncharacterized protein n=1 Tax=Micromonospora polyrhachis TaxID=1282883 RepID=A0A7W7SX13_9ACTN|nr:hypothetical protein [Micromonospora polyrhachis]MBB4961230.1 hypothetical protein [Micromonospora polyrhachis]
MSDGTESVETRLPVRVVAILGLLAVVTLLASVVALAVSWPTTPKRSSALPILLYAYDPMSARMTERPQQTFKLGQVPVATVEERAVGAVSRKRVRASWYDAVGHQTNSVDLSKLADLRTDPVLLSTTGAVPAGTYQFVLATVQGDRLEEVLAWVHVKIER